jgi:hypothetical protein
VASTFRSSADDIKVRFQAISKVDSQPNSSTQIV